MLGPVNSLRPGDTYICISNLTVIVSDNGLSPGRRQAIIWTKAGILLIGPLGTKFSEIVIEIQTFSLKKMRLKMSSAKCCSFRLGLNVLMAYVARRQQTWVWAIVDNIISKVLWHSPGAVWLERFRKQIIKICLKLHFFQGSIILWHLKILTL